MGLELGPVTRLSGRFYLGVFFLHELLELLVDHSFLHPESCGDDDRGNAAQGGAGVGVTMAVLRIELAPQYAAGGKAFIARTGTTITGFDATVRSARKESRSSPSRMHDSP